jgi:hypothetical protein
VTHAVDPRIHGIADTFQSRMFTGTTAPTTSALLNSARLPRQAASTIQAMQLQLADNAVSSTLVTTEQGQANSVRMFCVVEACGRGITLRFHIEKSAKAKCRGQNV